MRREGDALIVSATKVVMDEPKFFLVDFQAGPERAQPMALNYGKEKFYNATFILATGEGSIKERLEDAAIGLAVLQAPHDLPDNLRADYDALWATLTARPAEHEGEGTIQATIRQMETHEASAVAERIFNLYFRVLDTSPL